MSDRPDIETLRADYHARAIDQARREGYAAGVRAAAERHEALNVAVSSVIAEAETLAMTMRRRVVFNNLKAAYAEIRALIKDGEREVWWSPHRLYCTQRIETADPIRALDGKGYGNG